MSCTRTYLCSVARGCFDKGNIDETVPCGFECALASGLFEDDDGMMRSVALSGCLTASCAQACGAP